MKNIKNTVAAIGLMAVLGMGTATANAGILISDRATSASDTKCTPPRSENWAAKAGGMFAAAIRGIIVVGQNGILISDGSISFDGTSDNTCGNHTSAPSVNGILISD